MSTRRGRTPGRLAMPLVLLGLLGAMSLIESLAAGSACAELVTRNVSYDADGVRMQGYLAYDDASDARRPGILVVHEWWGANAYARQRAEMLGRAGFTALAVDMYGDGKTTEHPSEAREFASAVRADPEGAKKRFEAALRLLASQSSVDPDRIAAIGYCFGGSVVLDMARRGLPLVGVVSYHGGLGTSHPAKKGEVEARILVFNGEADSLVPKESIVAFEQEMTSAGARYELIQYPGAKHGFTNPEADAFGEKFGIPLGYDEHADQDSWSRTKKFFASIFERG